MSGFAADWLALREPADLGARNAELATSFAGWIGKRKQPATILDLGCGTGSTVRALSSRLPDAICWHLVDNDAALLERARAALPHATVERVDIAAGLDVIDRMRPDAVTASALADLASADWTGALVERAARIGAAVYVALTYDGRDKWSPPHPADAAVHAALLADMRRDKGFGPALGAEAAPLLATALGRAGYRVRSGPSPWRLGGKDRALIGELADGTARAATARIGDADLVEDWRMSRRSATDVVIGHEDVLALPPD